MPTNETKPPIFLLDSMAFIFRAYHAMQRSRPMSTRTGVPTAATYVFVNMINKLRKDFQPRLFRGGLRRERRRSSAMSARRAMAASASSTSRRSSSRNRVRRLQGEPHRDAARPGAAASRTSAARWKPSASRSFSTRASRPTT